MMARLTPIAAEEAALRGLASFFSVRQPINGAVSDFAKVRAGWPDVDSDIQYPALYLDIVGGGSREGSAPREISQEPTDGGQPWEIDSLMSIGDIEVNISLNIFAASRASRAHIGGLIAATTAEAAIATGGGSLCIPNPEYYDQPMTFWRSDELRYTDNSAAVGSDEWRGLTHFRCTTREVVAVSGTKLVSLQIGMVVAEGAKDYALYPVEMFYNSQLTEN